jgi:uncharacterized protein (TIGR03437 family)
MKQEFWLKWRTFCVVGIASTASLVAQEPTACPGFLPAVPAGVTCFTGTGTYGSPYLIVVPGVWNRTLILINVGLTRRLFTEAQSIGPPRFLLAAGYALAASDFHRPIAREAARDTEDLRQIFTRKFGRPVRTVAEGSSFGGLVAARLIELYGVASDGSRNYDGAAPRCGLVAGSAAASQVYLDLRVVYQYYCHNHPRPEEQQYGLWQGLPAGTAYNEQDLANRVNACTGVNLPAAQRTDSQTRNLANILNVTHIAEGGLLNMMRAATLTQADTVGKYLAGRNPVSNQDVTYRGSLDDEALNAGVLRYSADTSAAAALAEADDPSGAVPIPVVSMHAINDPERFVEQESAYRETFRKAGTADRLLQIFTTAGEHCLFTPAESLAQLTGLLQWLETGSKPAPENFAALCEQISAQPQTAGPCRFDPKYQPADLASVSPPRRLEPRCAAPSSPKIQAVVNGASFEPRLAANSMLTILGSGWTSGQIRRETLPLDLLDARFPLELACVGLRIGGVRAPVTFTSGSQINAQMPASLMPGPLRVEVISYPGQSVETRVEASGVPIGQHAPAFFLDGSRIIAQHADGARVTEKTPAARGEVVYLFGTGFGATEPLYQEGQIAESRAPLRDPISVRIAGTPLAASDIIYAGLVPGFISGVYEFAVRVPTNIAAGDSAVIIRIGGLETQAAAIISID